MSSALNIPHEFEQSFSETWKEKGKQWLRELPRIIEACRQQWSITVGDCVPDLSISYVAHATFPDGQPMILKIGCPHPELYTEMDALEAFHGTSSVKLLDKDRDLGALLLERIEPGRMLAELQKENEEEATTIGAYLIRDVCVPVPANASFPKVSDWVRNLEQSKSLEAIPHDMIGRAQRFATELDHSKREEKLLHGDLHHTNILLDEKRGWVAIDPKGVIGDPAFNAARFLRNGAVSEAKDPLALTRRRVEILSSTLQCESFRVAGWGYVDCLIGACWSAEGGGSDYNTRLAAPSCSEKSSETRISEASFPLFRLDKRGQRGTPGIIFIRPSSDAFPPPDVPSSPCSTS